MKCPGCETEMVFDRYKNMHKCPICAMTVRDEVTKDPIEIKDEDDSKK